MRKLMNGQIFVMIYLSIIIFFIRKVSKSIHTHGYTNVHTYVIALNLLCSIDFFFCIIFSHNAHEKCNCCLVYYFHMKCLYELIWLILFSVNRRSEEQRCFLMVFLATCHFPVVQAYRKTVEMMNCCPPTLAIENQLY